MRMMKNRKVLLIILTVVLVIVATGISYAWFYQRSALATLIDVAQPDSIKIIPVDDKGGDVTVLDLDFNESFGDEKQIDEETGNTKITIYRPIYVYSTSPVHQLEVVHTTNLSELTFEIYWTEKDKYTNIKSHLIEGNKIPGSYTNKDTNSSSLAKPEKLNNYKNDDIVEEHAYPLYWLANVTGDERYTAVTDKEKIIKNVNSEQLKNVYDPSKQIYRNYYKTYYYLVISWIETGKETDLFYILAQNIAASDSEGGSVNS